MRLADEIDKINNQSKKIADIRKEIEKEMENL
jgi:hypothetical protein